MPSGTGLKSFDFADSTSLSRSWPASFTSSRDASSVIQPFTWMRGSLSAGVSTCSPLQEFCTTWKP